MEPSTTESVRERQPRPELLVKIWAQRATQQTDRALERLKAFGPIGTALTRVETRYTKYASRVLLWSSIVVFALVGLRTLNAMLEHNGWNAQWMNVRSGSLQAKLLQMGKVESFTTVPVKSKQGGVITQILVEEGDAVKEGAPLAVIQQRGTLAGQLAQMRADIEKQERTTQRAVQAWQQQEELFHKDFISKLEFETARDQARSAETDLRVMKQKLKLMLDEIGSSQKDSDRVVIRSPIAGVVTRQLKEVGEYVSEAGVSYSSDDLTGAILTVADMGKILVTSKINEVDVWRVKKGQAVDIRLDAVPGVLFHGKVMSLAPAGESEKDSPIVNFRTKIEVSDADARVRPGMTADVDILTGSAENTLIVPLEAVTFSTKGDSEEAAVWVKRTFPLAPLKTTVKLGLQTPTEAQVIEGLQAGAQVMNRTQQKRPPN